MSVGVKIKKLNPLEELITCGICKKIYNDPRVLPECLHCFCKYCILKLVLTTGSGKSFSCPLCRSEVTFPDGGVDGLKSAFYFNHIKSMVIQESGHMSEDNDEKVEKCQACTSGHVVEAYCHTCKYFICGTCVNVHQTMIKVFEAHEVVSLQNLKEGPKANISTSAADTEECHHHQNIYCFNCDSLICPDCTEDHRDHRFQLCAEAAAEMKEELQKNLEPLRQVGDRLSRAVEELKSTRHEVEAQQDNIKREINEHFKMFDDTVKEHTQKLSEDADKIVSEKKEELSKQINTVCQALSKVQIIIESTDKCISDYTDKDTVSVYTDFRNIIEQEMAKSTLKCLEPVEKFNITMKKRLSKHDLLQLMATTKIIQPSRDSVIKVQKGEKEILVPETMFNPNLSGGIIESDITCNKFVELDKVSFLCSKDLLVDFIWNGHGIQMQYDACVPSESVEYHVSVLSLKEFSLPEHCEAVSAAYYIDCPVEFSSPVTLKIEHCAAESRLDDLCFITSSDLNPPYKFHFIKGEFDSVFGTIKMTTFSPILTILKNKLKKILPSSEYSAYLYCSKDYVHELQKLWDLYFYVVKRLTICEQSVRKSSTNYQKCGHFIVEFDGDADRITLHAKGIDDEPTSDNLYIRSITSLSLEKRIIRKHTMEEPPCCQLQLVKPSIDQHCVVQQFDMNGTKDKKFFKFVWPRAEEMARAAALDGVGELKIDDLGAVYEEICGAKNMWYEIGLQLKVPVDELDAITVDRSECGKSLLNVLSCWLRNSPNRTWKFLATAMGSNTVSRSDLRKNILTRHCN